MGRLFGQAGRMSVFLEHREVFLRDLAKLLGVDRQALTEDLPLTEDNWDSMALISGIALIDKHFNVTVSGDELRACQSSGDLLGVVQSATA
jgi:acyl carrier protein